MLLGPQGVLTADWWLVSWTLLTSCLAVAALAVALGGWFVDRATPLERALMAVGGLALLYANLRTDLVGLAALVVVVGLHVARVRRGRTAIAGA